MKLIASHWWLWLIIFCAANLLFIPLIFWNAFGINIGLLQTFSADADIAGTVSEIRQTLMPVVIEMIIYVMITGITSALFIIAVISNIVKAIGKRSTVARA